MENYSNDEILLLEYFNYIQENEKISRKELKKLLSQNTDEAKKIY